MTRRKLFLWAFLTGMAALILEKVWSRQLVIVLGSSSQSLTILLSAFMAGLGLGAWTWGRWAEGKDARQLLKAFGGFHLLIALYAAATPRLIGFYQQLYAGMGEMGDGALFFVRAAFAFGFILLPVFLMGGAFPVLSRGLSLLGKSWERDMPRFYALDLWGAVAGAVLTGYVLFYHLGVPKTILSAVCLEAWVGSWALWAARKEQAGETAAVAAPAGRPSWAALGILAFAFLSGWASLGYQLIYTRFFAAIFGSTVYSFTAVLTVSLLGLGLGSYGVSRFGFAGTRGFALLAGLQGLAALTALVHLWIAPYFPYLYFRAFSLSNGSFISLQVVQLVLASVSLLPLMAGLGATLPACVVLWKEKVYGTQGSPGAALGAGKVYGLNSLGSALGALVVGLWAIPSLGLEGGVKALLFLNISLAAAALGWGTPRQGLALGAALGVFLAALLKGPWDPRLIQTGVYLYGPLYARLLGTEAPSWSKWRQFLVQNSAVLYHKDGRNFTTDVVRQANGSLRLSIDGKADASTTLEDMQTQVLLARLPLLLKPQAKSGLVIGLASGVTLGELLNSKIERVDCVDIEPAMAQAQALFAGVNRRPLEDGRVRMIWEDGRNHLLRSRKTYDLIISEPPNPWVASASYLFSKDSLELAKARLTEEGLMVQWFHSYQFNPEDVRGFLATFRSVFPESYLWKAGEGGDLLAIGLKKERDPAGQRMDGTAFLRSSVDLASRFLLGPRGMREVSEGHSLFTDREPRLEFVAPRRMHNHKGLLENEALLAEAAEPITSYFEFGGKPGSKDKEGRAFLSGLLERYISRGLLKAAEGLLAEEGAGSLKESLNAKAYLALLKGRSEEAEESLLKALKLDPSYDAALGSLSQLYLARGNRKEALETARRLVRLHPGSAEAWNNLGVLYLKLGEDVEAEAFFHKALARNPALTSAHRNLGAIQLHFRKDAEGALRHLEEARRLEPQNAEVLWELSRAYAEAGRGDRARQALAEALRLRPDYLARTE